MADIGKDRFSEQEEEEGRRKKFQVIDKRFLADEEATVVEVATSPPASPPAVAAAPEKAPAQMVEETMKAGKTIKIDMSSTAPVAEAVAPVEAEAPAEADGALPPGLNPDPLAISNAMLFFIEELFSRVLIFLGLTPNPQTGLTVQNLDQAQKGIQLIELLIGEVKRELKSPEIDQNLSRMAAQLKAAYVQIVTGGGLGAPGGGGLINPGGR